MGTLTPAVDHEFVFALVVPRSLRKTLLLGEGSHEGLQMSKSVHALTVEWDRFTETCKMDPLCNAEASMTLTRPSRLPFLACLNARRMTQASMFEVETNGESTLSRLTWIFTSTQNSSELRDEGSLRGNAMSHVVANLPALKPFSVSGPDVLSSAGSTPWCWIQLTLALRVPVAEEEPRGDGMRLLRGYFLELGLDLCVLLRREPHEVSGGQRVPNSRLGSWASRHSRTPWRCHQR